MRFEDKCSCGRTKLVGAIVCSTCYAEARERRDTAGHLEFGSIANEPVTEHTIDGYTWEEFKAMMNTDPLPQHMRPGTEFWQRVHDTASFRAPDGARVTLHKDGTWSVDCAPDWNGAS